MNANRDYYDATLEAGALVMSPHCACGNALNDDYFCETCNRHCRCYHILCADEPTLALVRKYIRSSPQFAVYTAVLASDRAE